jgi:hypothetical protein
MTSSLIVRDLLHVAQVAHGRAEEVDDGLFAGDVGEDFGFLGPHDDSRPFRESNRIAPNA